jgi:asparagine synthase (glutamine-hydrolysing)
MCGICGIISRNVTDRDILYTMNNSMLHRGPDGEGFYFEKNVGLAMRRLAIIDIAKGWQPIYSEDQSLVLIFNGEIYNYIELMEQLKQEGHYFATRSDGEVIVHLYEKYATNCVSHLRGMFSFALWDKNAKKMMLCRDRMGEKPLYLYQDHEKLLFASELRTLLSAGIIDKELDPYAIDMYFRYQYVPEPHTLIKGIRKLPPATYMTINARLEVQETTYWKMEDSVVVTANPVDTMRQKLKEVGKLIIRSDVPVGVALSGGIDSSLVAALASSQYGNKMHAFTVGYDGRPQSDERNVAKRIADYLGITFHEIEITTDSFINSFPKICALADDPIADISAFGYYSVSKCAKENGIPVLLQGHGGDELAWGYKWLQTAYQLNQLKKRILNKETSAIIELYSLIMKERISNPMIRKNINDLLGLKKATHLLRKMKNYPDHILLYDSMDNFDANYAFLYGSLMDEIKRDQYKEINTLVVDSEEVTLTKLICNTYLLENGIAQGDRLSMANSVELRLPLIDYSLVETIIGIRKKHSDILDVPKKIFVDVAKEMLPEWLFGLPKRGFTPPVDVWVNALLNKYKDKIMNGNLIYTGIINEKSANLLKEGLRTPTIGFPLYFNALVLEFYLDSVL